LSILGYFLKKERFLILWSPCQWLFLFKRTAGRKKMHLVYLEWIFCKMGTCTGVEKRGHQPHLMKVPRALAAEVSRSGKNNLFFTKINIKA